LTGKGAEWGVSGKVSMEIAVEEINAKGGIAGEITMDEVRDGAGASAILKVVNGQYVNISK
jgi:ABC-type branched-subunit amino acid transport system substrate-binding protein